MFEPKEFFNVETTLFKSLLQGADYVWDGLKNIAPYIAKNITPNISAIPLDSLSVKKTTLLKNNAKIFQGAYICGDKIEIRENAVIEPGAYIGNNSIIGPNTQVRHGAYVRGNVITGPDCVIGHCSEVKNSCLLGNSKAGHFAYIGDSILGSVNLGAGTKLANLKLSGTEIKIKYENRSFQTGLRKLGAIMADGVQTGCNSVTSPGTILSKNTLLYPNTTAMGYYPPGTIIKLRQEILKETLK